MEGMLGGIIMPKLKNRWLMRSVSNLTQDENELLRLQLILCHFDYNPDIVFDSRYGYQPENKHTLLLVVEDPEREGMADIVAKLCNAIEPFNIIIDTIDPRHGHGPDVVGVTQRATYHRCKVKRYSYNLDYAASEACKYPILFAVDDVTYSRPPTDK